MDEDFDLNHPYDSVPFGDAQRFEDEQVARDFDAGEGREDALADRYIVIPEASPGWLVDSFTECEWDTFLVGAIGEAAIMAAESFAKENA